MINALLPIHFHILIGVLSDHIRFSDLIFLTDSYFSYPYPTAVVVI